MRLSRFYRQLVTSATMALTRQGLVRTTSALAQTVPTPATQDAQPAPAANDEITVTVRRRHEKLQSVPLSAEVIGGTSIAAKGVTSIQDLSSTLPAVRLAKGSTTDRQFVRGIGCGDNPNFEQSVGTFIDDVYHGRARTSEGGLFDLD